MGDSHDLRKRFIITMAILLACLLALFIIGQLLDADPNPGGYDIVR